MNYISIENLITSIPPLDADCMQVTRTHQDTLTKPMGSLGRLEELSIQVAGITSNPNPQLHDKVVLVMASDHGIVDEGVSAYPQAVTAQMVSNFLNGGAAINVLARHVGARVVVVDMGVSSQLEPHAGLIQNKIAFGTKNMTLGPAMTREQAIRSILAGAEIVNTQIELGLDILATGDMGIGNTSPSAAIAAVFTNKPLKEIVGRGTGVDDVGLDRKIVAIQRAILVNNADANDGIDVLAKVGGFEIGGLVGAILAAASQRRPVVIDGYISTAAAMIAVKLAPLVGQYLIAAHTSQERGHHLMMDWLGVKPLLDLQMRLGEGTGSVLAMSLVDAACKILNEMSSFSEAGVAQKESQ